MSEQKQKVDVKCYDSVRKIVLVLPKSTGEDWVKFKEYIKFFVEDTYRTW